MDKSDAGASGAAMDRSHEIGIRHGVAAPIVVEGRVWGVIGVGTSRTEPPPADTEARLSAFAELLATAIANAESRAGLARLAEDQAALRRVATLVADGVAAEEVSRSRRLIGRVVVTVLCALCAWAVAPQTGAMSARHATLLAALAVIWGGSYLLIKYALDGFSAAMIVSARSLLASLVLLLVLWSRGLARSALADMGARPKSALGLAMTAVAAPFLLITYGEHVVPSGLTAVLISPASLFVALLAPFILPSERIERRQGAGMLLALGGVSLVVGVESVHSLKEFLGALAMIGAAFFYALSSFVVKARYGSLAAVQTSWISVTVAGLLTLPAGVSTTLGHSPGLGAIAALAALGVVGTAAAFVIFYELINGIGTARASLVSYLAPGVALFYGAIFLHEAITIAAAAGLVAILGGLAIASRRPGRAAAPVPAPGPARA